LPQVAPISTLEYPTPHTRPLDTMLDCAAIVSEFVFDLRPWRAELEETLNRLLANKDFL
jgi:dTDP-4-dehydrorhamnose reductase